MSDPLDPRVPANSLLFGFGPMLPLAAAALGTWTLPPPWPGIAIRLAIVWAAIVLVFIAGVRRGFGFGWRSASTPVEIATMLAYSIPAGIALVLPSPHWSMASLLIGFGLVLVLDPIAAGQGDAPAHFATLRPPQITIALASLLALIVH